MEYQSTQLNKMRGCFVYFCTFAIIYFGLDVTMLKNGSSKDALDKKTPCDLPRGLKAHIIKRYPTPVHIS
jgi:hypothetical protein